MADLGLVVGHSGESICYVADGRNGYHPNLLFVDLKTRFDCYYDLLGRKFLILTHLHPQGQCMCTDQERETV